VRINTETSVGLFVLGALAIFFYMTFRIGVFRLDSSDFRKQFVYFNDVSGLTKKADVKIAGVKVGWVADIDLAQSGKRGHYSAKAEIMVNNQYQLRADAYASVRQDGLLGTKYLEIVPGDPSAPSLKYGAPLGKPGQAPASVDDLIQQFKTVATNVEEITGSIKDSLVSPEGKQRMVDIMKDLHTTAARFASFSHAIDRIVSTNEDDVNGIVRDVRVFASQMRETMPLIKDDFHRLAAKLTDDTLPSFDKNVARIANVFDRDFGGIADKLESTADAIEEAALQTRDGFRSFGSVAGKIDDGKGLIGKLVNEDQTYHDLKVAVQGLKNYFSKVESLGIVFDSHFETMYSPAENFKLKDAKGYFDIRIHPNEDHFYLLQLMGSTKGSISRTVTDRVWYDSNGDAYNVNEVLTDLPAAEAYRKLEFAPEIEQTIRTRDTKKFGFQFGKTFKDTAFRFGLFDGTFGVGMDYDIPFANDKLRWVTSFEAFDMRGRDRINDQRPHLKWINRVFFLRNFYVDFGADDFISRHNANAFFGFGLRFCDDDIKYFISKLGVTGGGGMG
jgi:phospholipid/cholesterol/gamma-HCH transport system substrate-binding protein